ncbi:MAG: F0F1 ATP synthase subunit epsilon [Dehalococcoidia bacterium]|nr:F0F1 ATP synthase subunit epsilon [Dehalococcoidia bacterium]
MLHLEVLTAESAVISTDVDSVVATTLDGQIGVLRGHVPLVTVLRPGELILRTGEHETYLAVSGGFLRVMPDRVIVLADACEYAEEIDVERAEAARRRAEELLRAGTPDTDAAAAEAALRRSIARLRVVDRYRTRVRRRPYGEPAARDDAAMV